MSKKRAMKKAAKKRITVGTVGVGKSGTVYTFYPVTIGAADITEVARAIRSLEERGIPLCDDKTALAERHADECEGVVKVHLLYALELIEATYRGDHTVFRNIADALSTKPRYTRKKEVQALVNAAKKHGRKPTDLEVFEEAKKLGNESGCQVLAELKTNLASQGFPIKSSRGRGRPKKPK